MRVIGPAPKDCELDGIETVIEQVPTVTPVKLELMPDDIGEKPLQISGVLYVYVMPGPPTFEVAVRIVKLLEKG